MNPRRECSGSPADHIAAMRTKNTPGADALPEPLFQDALATLL